MCDAHDELERRAETELRMCSRHVVKPVMAAAQAWVAKMTHLLLPFRPSLEYILDACVCTQRLNESVACALASLRLILCRSYPGSRWLLEKNFEEILLWICSHGSPPEQVMAGLQLDLFLSIQVRVKHQLVIDI